MQSTVYYLPNIMAFFFLNSRHYEESCKSLVIFHDHCGKHDLHKRDKNMQILVSTAFGGMLRVNAAL